MTATTSPLQLQANRVNALLSTGPRTPAGKSASSGNARSHGLTSRLALIPGEDPTEYQAHHAAHLAHYQPHDSLNRAAVIELADLQWRLRRVPEFEAQLLSYEVRNLNTNPELTPLTEHLESDAQILALAFSRLVQNKVLPSLYSLESRLSRRADKLQKLLTQDHPQLPASDQPQPEPPPEPEITAEPENLQIEPIQPRRVTKIGRNEQCPCHSGLKYKRCCANKPDAAAAVDPS